MWGNITETKSNKTVSVIVYLKKIVVVDTRFGAETGTGDFLSSPPAKL
jgi:hypothetical protein